MTGRTDRRYTGDPEYPLDKVRACISVSQFRVTRKAQYVDGPRVLPPGTIDVFGSIKEIVVGLTEACWSFAQVEDGEWADVYRVVHHATELWVKLKIELEPTAKEYAIVISFHEWDHSRDI